MTQLQEENLEVISWPSPYFTDRTIQPIFIVMHSVASEDLLMKNNVSAHYLIPLQNDASKLRVYELVQVYPQPLRAWHAGVSRWKGYEGLNDYALGIEIVLPGYEPLHFKPYHYQDLQIEALKILVKTLQARFSIPPKNIIAHSDIAIPALRRDDPPPPFPWKALARVGIGVWPDGDCPDEIRQDLSATGAQRLLEEVGYSVTLTREFDKATNSTLAASRLHWDENCFNESSHLTTLFDAEANSALAMSHLHRDNGFSNESSDLMPPCYQQPFNAEYACTLFGASTRRDVFKPDGFPGWAISICVIAPLLALAGLWFCHRHRCPSRKGYSTFGKDSKPNATAVIQASEERKENSIPSSYQAHV